MFVNGYATSTGYSWSSTSYTGVIPKFAYRQDRSHVYTTGIFGNVNGDGLPDFEEFLPSAYKGASIVNGSYFEHGSAWDSATPTIFIPVADMPDPDPTYTNSQLVDINGDGLDDWVYSDSQNTYVQINTGTQSGDTSSSQWRIGTSTLYASSGTFYDRGMRFMNINGDGLPDFVRTSVPPLPHSTVASAMGMIFFSAAELLWAESCH